MKLHTLISSSAKAKKRVGRGYGSGRGGHTSSRGTKGQKARGSIPAYFVGTSWVWFKRLPFMRGKSRFSSLKPTTQISLSELNLLPARSVIDLQSLHKAGIIDHRALKSQRVKLIAKGKLTKKLTLAISASAGAKKAIQEAGGVISAPNT